MNFDFKGSSIQCIMYKDNFTVHSEFPYFSMNRLSG